MTADICLVGVSALAIGLIRAHHKNVEMVRRETGRKW